ncbi:MAG: hypothetical protein MMC23_001142 [Stictis urceolatum]|nr:hypothetical protein [Stictis urceolata]
MVYKYLFHVDKDVIDIKAGDVWPARFNGNTNILATSKCINEEAEKILCRSAPFKFDYFNYISVANVRPLPEWYIDDLAAYPTREFFEYTAGRFMH